MSGLYLVRGADAVHQGHLYIHQYPVRAVLLVGRKCARAVAAFEDALHQVHHKALHHAANLFVVIYDQDVHQRGRFRFGENMSCLRAT